VKILVVDDEPLARARLKALIDELRAGEVVGEAGHGAAAIELVGSITCSSPSGASASRRRWRRRAT